MLEKIEQLRKAPHKVRERFVALVTVALIAVVTIIWFLFSLSSFLDRGVSGAPAQNAPGETAPPAIEPPFTQ